jgi:hypothetical protein
MIFFKLSIEAEINKKYCNVTRVVIQMYLSLRAMSRKEENQEEGVSCCTNAIKPHEFPMSNIVDRYADRARPRLSLHIELSASSCQIYNSKTT